jgi:hypothetical protein
VTAIRDRQSDPDADDVSVPWDERLVVGSRRGLPWWLAVLLALGLAVVGAVLGKPAQGNLPLVFKVCYVAGAVLAVCLVRRRGIFGPMVQPPLVLAVTVPAVVLATSGSQGGDTLSKALNIATPLINGFPTMAITTGITLLIGLIRIFRERDPNAPVKLKKGQAARRDPDGEKPSARAAASSAPGRPRPPGSNRSGQTPVPPGGRRGSSAEPPRRARPPADAERRAPRTGDPASRGTRKPPPGATRQQRAPRPDEDPRRSGETPRRPRPPRTGDSRGQDNPPPRRPNGGRETPPRRRPWDEDQR